MPPHVLPWRWPRRSARQMPFAVEPGEAVTLHDLLVAENGGGEENLAIECLLVHFLAGEVLDLDLRQVLVAEELAHLRGKLIEGVLGVGFGRRGAAGRKKDERGGHKQKSFH